jgi:hypothetical protein
MRKQMKKNFDFLSDLVEEEKKRKILRRATESQLDLLAQIIHLIFSRAIALKEDQFNIILKKRKYGFLETTFKSKEKLQFFEKLDKQEKCEIFCKLSVVLKPLLYCLFHR